MKKHTTRYKAAQHRHSVGLRLKGYVFSIGRVDIYFQVEVHTVATSNECDKAEII